MLRGKNIKSFWRKRGAKTDEKRSEIEVTGREKNLEKLRSDNVIKKGLFGKLGEAL